MDISNHQIKRYSVKDGLPNDNINSILSEGDSALWIGTDLGLSRFDIKENSFINFFVQDGLPDNEFNRISFHKAKDGRMYLGGLNGIIAFFPEELMKQYKALQQQSEVVFTSFSKESNNDQEKIHQAIHWNNETPIEIFHNDQNYTFAFALTE